MGGKEREKKRKKHSSSHHSNRATQSALLQCGSKLLLISAQEETAAARCVVASVLPALTEVNKQRVASCSPPPLLASPPLGTLHCGTSCWFIFLRSLSAGCLSRVRAPSPPSHPSPPSPCCPGRIDGALKGLGCHDPSVAGG